MGSMTSSTSSAGFADVRHHPAARALLVILGWIAAAAVVATAHVELDGISPSAGAVAIIAALIAVAGAYTRLCARRAGITHALGVGIVWLVLAILTEIIVTTRLGVGWYGLLGSPDRPLLRNIFLFAWIFAPVLFARAEDEE